MTEKQENILKAALELFAQDGFKSTSTSKVATRAGVSEGLIFRHFENKEGLLKAILTMGEEKFKEIIVDIVMEPDPKEVIRKTILMPTKIDKSDYDFWKLQFKLKWELEVNSDGKLEPLHMALTSAFKKLNYEMPETQAHLLLLYIDGFSSSILKGSSMKVDDITSLLQKKYKL
jgi:AcrR family transcriptional regulator